MQSVFTSWPQYITPRVQPGKAAYESIRASPGLDMVALSKLKRKRTDSPESFTQFRVQPAKKQREDAPTAIMRPVVKIEPAPALKPEIDGGADEAACQTVMSHEAIPEPSTNREGATTTTVKAQFAPNGTSAMSHDVDLRLKGPQVESKTDAVTRLQQVIENQFNLQILSKHNELRLIEQELAKCQVALEQLRRCELRPYPGSEALSLAVSTGTGPAVEPSAGFSRPPHAAPYGVTDGPYTTHYRQWLLRDPQFDSSPAVATPFVDTPLSADSRSSRQFSSVRRPTEKSISVSTPVADLNRPQSNFLPPTKKLKLAIVKRSTDSQLVKLTCNHCHRSDFSNSQGFLNHCRIAHKLEYKSHDDAAIDCGQLLDEHELANVPPEVHAAPVAKASGSRSGSASGTPFKVHNYVHPMINSTGAAASSTAAPSPLAPRQSMSTLPPSVSTANKSTPPNPAWQNIHLTAHFAKHNPAGNIEQAIAAARQKVDLGAEEELSPETPDTESPTHASAPGARTTLSVSRAGSLAPSGDTARPPSRKGYRQPASKPRPSPLTYAASSAGPFYNHEPSSPAEFVDSPRRNSNNLSPHTIDGNPGLVSDHEDDDHGSASEDEVPQATIAHSLGMRGRDCTDDMDLDVAVDDDIDEHGVIIRRNSMVADERGLKTTAGSSRKL